MIFEDEKYSISVPVYDDCFIYFLLDKNEVVYVGKTTQGISRPFNHKSSKKFDQIKIIYFESDKLDEMEDFFIKKYKPKYNKISNYNQNYSLKRVIEKLKNEKVVNKISVVKLKKILKTIGVSIFIDEYTGKENIASEDYEKIKRYIGGDYVEIHNRGI